VKVALVVQRYGADVLGGAETLARRVAELLAPELELTVVTTCALDYLTWADHYPPGEDDVNGVRVLRFPVSEPRDAKSFDRATAKAYRQPNNLETGRAWMRAQGPHSEGLLQHLREEGERYDAIAFVTYLYATTAEGLPLVAERSLLCPTMHDEPPLRLAIFDEIFAAARLCLFLTPEERELARRRFGVPDTRARLVGAGIDEPAEEPPDFEIDHPYALYVGRLDPSKGVPELLDHHARYRTRFPDGLDLVLVGEGYVDVPAGDGFHRLGFVAEEVRDAALANATAVVCPSPYESLSFSQLEAWAHGRPTLASAVSPVLVGQSRRSGGGLWYADGDEYAAMLDLLARDEALAWALGAQGRRHVHAEYSWERVRTAWLAALEEVASGTAAGRYPAGE
jgi:glycosyltransferase involved in cell wall biosynthesis